MNDEPKVWIRERACKGGRTTYHLRWVDPEARKWKSRAAGPDGKPCTDRKRAERAAAKLEEDLLAGTHVDVRKIAWADFVAEHVARIPGDANRSEARRALDEFGNLQHVAGPRAVTFAMIESYAEALKAKGRAKPETTAPPVAGEAKPDGDAKTAKPPKIKMNSPATIAKKLRYVRAALRKAVKRGYIGRSPMEGWQWQREEETAPRIVTPEEEAAITQAAKELYGQAAAAFIRVGVETGARRGEVLGLTWDRIDLDGASIHVTRTKGKRDRLVPVNPEIAAMLRKLYVQTQQDGGPFAAIAANIDRIWERSCLQAKVEGATIHDLRRTCITRLIRAGVPLPTVQKLVGHADIKTTLKFYNWTSEQDMREGVAKLRRDEAVG